MARPRGKSRILSVYEACEQIERLSKSKGIDLVEFAVAYQKFVEVYSRLVESLAKMNATTKKSIQSKRGSIRYYCRATWRYAQRHKIDPVFFGKVLMEYAEIRQNYNSSKKMLLDFRVRYDGEKGDSTEN